MRGNVDRDRSIEQLLGDALKRHANAAPSEACLDAETAAAWADGTLSAADRKRIEGHAASCARCQALVAALVRTAPPAPARSTSWFRLPRLAILAPLTAVAAALLVWAIVPPSATRNTSPPVPAEQKPVAEVHATAAPPAALPSAAAESTAAAKPAAPASPPKTAFADRRVDTRALDSLAKKDAPAEARNELQRERAKNEAAAPRQPSSSAVQESVSVTGAAPVVAAPPPAAAAPAPQSADMAMRKMATGSSVAQLQAPLPIVIVSPDANIRWRIVSGNQRVEYSTNAGATWTPQPIGDRTRVTAGFSPSSTVCWLVGPGGTVLRTTDAATWRRVAFPETTDLVAVRAIDAASATVTTADGRTFTTSDAGVTWTGVR